MTSADAVGRPLVLLLLAGLSAATAAQPAPTPGLAPFPPKPLATIVTAEHAPGVIEVKFAHGSGVVLVDGAFQQGGAPRDDVNEVLARHGAAARPMFVQSAAWLDAWRAAGEAASGLLLHDLTLFAFVDLPAAGSAAALCDELNALGIVQLAWPATRGGDPVVLATAPPAADSDDPGATPDFQGLQDYREAAPAGIDANHANSFSGGRGQGVTIVDCETGWTDDHEDLAATAQDAFVGFTPAPYPWDHGTAVLGELVGGANGFGVQGICHEAEVRMSTHSPVGQPQNIPGSVANGAAVLQPGDVLVIEIQCFGAAPGPFPCEFDPAIFATVQTATANGIHVFAAAGNGNHDLDAAAYGGAFNLAVKDSGAVIVGASDGVSLAKASFSNHGSRLTSHGWGFDVVTTGYGSLLPGPATAEYADDFSGTSSATPIVAGAGVILAAVHRETFGTVIPPLALRALLASTGTSQQGTQVIGSRPDLRAALRELGVPEIALSGQFVPGGTLEVTSLGDAGDPYVVFWSPVLLPAPLSVPTWGDLFLDPLAMASLPVGGVVGPGGTATDSYAIPDNPALSGLTTWFQGAQAFTSKPGVGSVSNVVAWRFP